MATRIGWNLNAGVAGRNRAVRIRPETLTRREGAATIRATADYETGTRRFTLAEYERLIEPGAFQSDDLVDRALEVDREPIPDSAAPFGWRSARSETFDASARVTALAAPGSSIRVWRLLP
jgi:hypothetical protein